MSSFRFSGARLFWKSKRYEQKQAYIVRLTLLLSGIPPIGNGNFSYNSIVHDGILW
jgi:hypothetical protein